MEALDWLFAQPPWISLPGCLLLYLLVRPIIEPWERALTPPPRVRDRRRAPARPRPPASARPAPARPETAREARARLRAQGDQPPV